MSRLEKLIERAKELNEGARFNLKRAEVRPSWRGKNINIHDFVRTIADIKKANYYLDFAPSKESTQEIHKLWVEVDGWMRPPMGAGYVMADDTNGQEIIPVWN